MEQADTLCYKDGRYPMRNCEILPLCEGNAVDAQGRGSAECQGGDKLAPWHPISFE